jgi:hypothetical protein
MTDHNRRGIRCRPMDRNRRDISRCREMDRATIAAVLLSLTCTVEGM